jgi:hypothetical protein
MKRVRRLIALGVLLGLLALAYDRFARPPGPEELAALRREHQALSGRVRARLAVEAEPRDAAPASVVVGVPVPFAERLSGELAAGLLSAMHLRLADLDVEKSGDLEAHLLMGRTQIGHFVVHVHLDEIRAALRAGRPQVRLRGPLVNVAMPVTVTEGTGRGRLRLDWDGRGVAGGVCGDFSVEGEIAGTVVPSTYTLQGRLALSTEGQTLVAKPETDDASLQLHVEPSAETWALVDKAIASRGGLCRAAVGAADVPEKLRAVVDRGFAIALPKRFLPELRFPVELERAVDVGGDEPLRLEVRPAGLEVTRTAIWYRSDVRVLEAKEAEPQAPAEAPGALTTPGETATAAPTATPTRETATVTPGATEATATPTPTTSEGEPDSQTQ